MVSRWAWAGVGILLITGGAAAVYAMKKGETGGGGGVRSITITASDPADGEFRDWYLFVDKAPGTYLGGGQYSGGTPTFAAARTSGAQLVYDLSGLTPGKHTLYFVITQSGGPSLGTYAGKVTVGSQSISFSGVDATHPFSFPVNVVLS